MQKRASRDNDSQWLFIYSLFKIKENNGEKGRLFCVKYNEYMNNSKNMPKITYK